MKPLMRWAFGLMLCNLIFACSSEGDSDGSGNTGKKKKKEEPDPPPGFSLTTTVKLDTLSYKELPLTSCMQGTEHKAFPQNEVFNLDGQIGDWKHLPAVLSDPLGDADVGDLSEIFVAATEGGVAIAGIKPSSGNLNFEFGGINISKGTLNGGVDRQIAVVEEQIIDSETNIPIPGARYVNHSATFEAFLPDRYLGESTIRPAFWVRVFTNGTNQQSSLGDSTHAAYFLSLQDSDIRPFQITECTKWSTQRRPFRFTYVYDSSYTTSESDGEAMARMTFQLSRYAFDSVNEMWPMETLPVSQMTVVMTQNDTTAFTISEHRSYGPCFGYS